jgi:hypothetical protein
VLMCVCVRVRGRARYAYVDFKEPAAVAAARALSESLLDGRRVLIKGASDYGRDAGAVAASTPAAGPDAGADPSAPAGKGATKGKTRGRPSPTVFVGNLSFQCTDAILRNAMSAFGPVQNVRLAVFADTGRCKGCVAPRAYAHPRV